VTSEARFTSEVDVLDVLVPPDSIAASARARERARRLIVLRGPSNVDRVFALSGGANDVEGLAS
jgi:hypothetical protein